MEKKSATSSSSHKSSHSNPAASRKGGKHPALAGASKAKPHRKGATDRPVRADRSDRPERAERPARAERSERSEQGERPRKPAGTSASGGGKPAYGEKKPAYGSKRSAGKPSNGKPSHGKPTGGKPAFGKPARKPRPQHEDGAERPARAERSDRPARADRPERAPRREAAAPKRKPAMQHQLEDDLTPVLESQASKPQQPSLIPAGTQLSQEVQESSAPDSAAAPLVTTTFADLGLMPELLEALEAEGYESPTPVQAKAIPHALAGKDVLGLAQTGTGKTAAFSLPLLQRLQEGKGRGRSPVRALILTPTRELALQILESIENYGDKLQSKAVAVLGGVSIRPQISALRRNPEIVVATPGRLIDLMEQGAIYLDKVEMLVLDEADRMLDMGFMPSVRRIVAEIPKQRQTLFFSATMPTAVTQLANSMLINPVRVEITPSSRTADGLEQFVRFVDRPRKLDALMDIIEKHPDGPLLVFARTRRRADMVATQLDKRRVRAEAIHSDRTQGARQRALDDFSRGKVRILVATDIVARGIDVDGIACVVNFDLPDEPEAYVHRIGRTARAGRKGMAISFCDAEELMKLKAIERTTGQVIPTDADHEFHVEMLEQFARAEPKGARGRGRGRRRPQHHHRPSDAPKPVAQTGGKLKRREY